MGCRFSQPVEPVDFDSDSEVNLYHFDLHRVIGKGTLSKVQIVEHKRSGQLYALKCIDKAQCIGQTKAVTSIIQERQVLQEITHTFIVNLHYAFQDDENCFFVLDLMLGGDLRFYIKSIKQIPESHVRIWVAELSSALDYLHRQQIIHRDIKPDNILLDSMGHAHITGFNVAVHYSDGRLHTGLAGTIAYMAPQVIKNDYSWQVDWWSLGVTAYEILFNKLPFSGRDVEETTNSILNDVLIFPEPTAYRCSSAAISALQGFIDRDPLARLCCRTGSQGLEGIRRHPWFAKSFDWDALERKDYPPPFVPEMNEMKQVILQMQAYAIDEFCFAIKPLKHSKRKANPDLVKMKPGLRRMEEQFMDFDSSRMSRVP